MLNRTYCLFALIAALNIGAILYADVSTYQKNFAEQRKALADKLLSQQKSIDHLLTEQETLNTGKKYLAPLLAQTTEQASNRTILPRFVSKLFNGTNFNISADAPTQPLIDLLDSPEFIAKESDLDPQELKETTFELYRQNLLHFIASQKDGVDDEVDANNLEKDRCIAALDDLFFHPVFGKLLRPYLTNLSARLITLYNSNLRDHEKRSTLTKILEKNRDDILLELQLAQKKTPGSVAPVTSLHTFTTSLGQLVKALPRRHIFAKGRKVALIIGVIAALITAGVAIYHRKLIMRLLRSVPHDMWYLFKSIPFIGNYRLEPQDMKMVHEGFMKEDIAMKWINLFNPAGELLRKQDAEEHRDLMATRNATEINELQGDQERLRVSLVEEQEQLDRDFGPGIQPGLEAQRDALAAGLEEEMATVMAARASLERLRQNVEGHKTELDRLLGEPVADPADVQGAAVQLKHAFDEFHAAEKATHVPDSTDCSLRESERDRLTERMASLAAHHQAQSARITATRNALATQANPALIERLEIHLRAKRAAEARAIGTPTTENKAAAKIAGWLSEQFRRQQAAPANAAVENTRTEMGTHAWRSEGNRAMGIAAYAADRVANAAIRGTNRVLTTLIDTPGRVRDEVSRRWNGAAVRDETTAANQSAEYECRNAGYMLKEANAARLAQDAAVRTGKTADEKDRHRAVLNQYSHVVDIATAYRKAAENVINTAQPLSAIAAVGNQDLYNRATARYKAACQERCNAYTRWQDARRLADEAASSASWADSQDGVKRATASAATKAAWMLADGTGLTAMGHGVGDIGRWIGRKIDAVGEKLDVGTAIGNVFGSDDHLIRGPARPRRGKRDRAPAPAAATATRAGGATVPAGAVLAPPTAEELGRQAQGSDSTGFVTFPDDQEPTVASTTTPVIQ